MSHNVRKRTFWYVRPTRFNSSCASTQSDQCHRRPHEETSHSGIFKLCSLKILIRLREYAGCSESSLGAHIQRYVVWRCGSSKIQLTLVISTSLISNTAYLEVKIWSLPKDENLTTGNKILWKRGDIAPKEQFLLFSTVFSIYLEFLESSYIYICKMWLFDLFLPQFCNSDMSRYGYLEVFQRVRWNLR